jgi:hypothetical protein
MRSAAIAFIKRSAALSSAIDTANSGMLNSFMSIEAGTFSEAREHRPIRAY